MRSDFYETARFIRRIRTQKRLQRQAMAAAVSRVVPTPFSKTAENRTVSTRFTLFRPQANTWVH